MDGSVLNQTFILNKHILEICAFIIFVCILKCLIYIFYLNLVFFQYEGSSYNQVIIRLTSYNGIICLFNFCHFGGRMVILICDHSWPFLDLLLFFRQFHSFIDSLVSEMTAQVCSVASLILKCGIFCRCTQFLLVIKSQLFYPILELA